MPLLGLPSSHGKYEALKWVPSVEEAAAEFHRERDSSGGSKSGIRHGYPLPNGINVKYRRPPKIRDTPDRGARDSSNFRRRDTLSSTFPEERGELLRIRAGTGKDTKKQEKKWERPILLSGGDSGSPLTQSNRRGSLNNRFASSSSEELQPLPRPKKKKETIHRERLRRERRRENNVRRRAAWNSLVFSDTILHEDPLCNLSTGAQLMLNDKTERNLRKSDEWCVGPTEKPCKNAASEDTANCKAPSYRKLPSTRPKNARRIVPMNPSSFLPLRARIAHRMRSLVLGRIRFILLSYLRRRSRLSVASIVPRH